MSCAIGESIIAVGIGAAGTPVDGDLVLAGVLGLALSACLWWSYFAADEGLAERRMDQAPMCDRPRLAINAFGYWHLLILLGIISISTALKETTAHPFDELETAKALALGGGVAIFLIGEALFRQTLAMGAARGRALAALIALATIPIGASASATAQLVILLILLTGMLAFEQRTAFRQTADR